MSAPSVIINLDSKLGAGFLGNLIAGIFYGITCVQTYIYFTRNGKDTTQFRILILFLWLLDTLHLALVTHGLYYYLVSNYGNLLALAFPTWSFLVQVYITCISDLIIRGVFGRRVWLMAGKSKIIAAGITTTSLLTFITGFAFATRAFAVKAFVNSSQISHFLYISLGSGVVADTFIAGSLCHSLAKSRTGFRKTDSLVNVLMVYAINTCLLTTVCSTACFITYTVWPNEFTFIGIYFSLSKLFFNSLLATLNSRESLSEKISGISDISMSDILPQEPCTSPVLWRPAVLVNINREVVEDYEQGRTEKGGQRLAIAS
ncbi:hypothetical protein Hypma_014793 [Hypsizygus marmoreus]|uniref:DUF6534 domain-containing protein n=1 Tax=Hypsizygus marmoreus TaxID=39966 RepID=A0A369K5C5_HYPMA|nr:hypothetical protein Hypma_014793 [Hypsizygus marmoreus]